MPNQSEYAVYKGESLLCIGTARECAEELNVRPETIRWYTYPTYQRRLAKRKNPKNCLMVVKLEDDEDELL